MVVQEIHQCKLIQKLLHHLIHLDLYQYSNLLDLKQSMMYHPKFQFQFCKCLDLMGYDLLLQKLMFENHHQKNIFLQNLYH